jgi:hypothetical protein
MYQRQRLCDRLGKGLILISGAASTTAVFPDPRQRRRATDRAYTAERSDIIGSSES